MIKNELRKTSVRAVLSCLGVNFLRTKTLRISSPKKQKNNGKRKECFKFEFVYNILVFKLNYCFCYIHQLLQVSLVNGECFIHDRS